MWLLSWAYRVILLTLLSSSHHPISKCSRLSPHLTSAVIPTSKTSAYFCFFPTCGHRATTLQPLLSHLAEDHHLFIPGMDYEFDLFCELLADPHFGAYFQQLIFQFLWARSTGVP